MSKLISEVGKVYHVNGMDYTLLSVSYEEYHDAHSYEITRVELELQNNATGRITNIATEDGLFIDKLLSHEVDMNNDADRKPKHQAEGKIQRGLDAIETVRILVEQQGEIKEVMADIKRLTEKLNSLL